MPTEIDLIGYRRQTLWHIVESQYFVFHVDNKLEQSDKRDQLIQHIDALHFDMCNSMSVASELDPGSLLKLNFWLYDSQVLQKAGLLDMPGRRMFYGASSSSGIHVSVHEMAWDSAMVIDRIVHEDAHTVWSKNVGETPSLLNEGIAAYFERRLSREKQTRLKELSKGWAMFQSIGDKGWLKRMCINDYFWEMHTAGLPAYEVGGHLVRFIVETKGIKSLKEIFLASSFEDEALAVKLESLLQTTLEDLESQLRDWHIGT